VPVLIALLHKLATHKLDDGFPEFQPSNLEVTDLEVGNPAHNVIPARASARLNIRFNPNWKGAELVAWIEGLCREAETGFNGRVVLTPTISGEAFFTQPDRFVNIVSDAVEAVVGRKPELSTSGGTSDARFFRALCPVLEFGLLGTTMHMVDERTPVAEVEALTRIYEGVITGYFQAFGSA
jgi:succinyl-diaminopimelate desuccinylase